jgi:hypothetical protein
VLKDSADEADSEADSECPGGHLAFQIRGHWRSRRNHTDTFRALDTHGDSGEGMEVSTTCIEAGKQHLKSRWNTISHDKYQDLKTTDNAKECQRLGVTRQ